MLPAFLTTVLFAISGVSANRTSRKLGGIRANFYRITLATALLAVWAHAVGSGIAGQAFPYFLVSGVVGFGLGDLALYQALPRLGSRLSILLVHCLAAPFAAAAEWLWLRTMLTPMQIAASAIILIGVAIALVPGEHVPIPRRLLIVGIAFGTMAAIGQGFGAVVSRKAYQVAVSAGQQIDGLTAAYQRILAGWVVGLLAFAFWRERASLEGGPERFPGRRLWAASPWVALNALAGPTLGVGCYQWALATRPTGVVLPIVATTPIVVIPFARLIEGERPTMRSLIGGAIAVIGAILMAFARS
ncbi:MAG: DMT family transporter [Verrucomicrobiota bacterium]